MISKYILIIAVLFSICSSLPLLTGYAVADQDAPPSSQPVEGDNIVATVNDQAVRASELAAHIAATGLPRDRALDDLIDLKLLRAAANANHVSAPDGAWNAGERARVEYDLAKALSLYVPPVMTILVVDHAWVKDAVDKEERAAQRALVEKMRALVETGATIPAAYSQLTTDGAAWHIGDHEEYPYEVIPAEARDLPAGSLSGIIPADGGLHLFKIWQRKESLPPSEEVREIVRSHLFLNATIDIPE